nr:hypothetical protein [Tanacetum cinerariifolium]
MEKNLALIAKYFKKIYKPTNNNLKTSSNSKTKNVDMTLRFKNDDHSGQFRTQRTVNIAGTREKVGSQVVKKSGIQCFNCKEYGHFAMECRKPKRVKDSTYHKEKMLLCKQAEQGVPLQAEQYDCDDEHVMLANLIANLKLDVDENKKIQKQLKKGNTTLAQELKECKDVLAETSKYLGESISVRDSCLVALQTKQTEFEKYKAFNDHTVDYDKLKCKLNETLGQIAHKDTVIREGLKTKAYELLVVKEKHDELMKHSLLTKSHYEGLVKQKTKYVESLEKEIDELESEKAEFSYMYDVILHDCVSKDVMYSYFQLLSDLDVLAELQSLNVFRKERDQYFKIQDLKAQMQDKNIAISELKKLIKKSKGKYVDTKFDRPFVVRQLNAQRIPKPLVLGKLTPFSDSLERRYFLKTKSIPKTNVSKGLSKPVTTQTVPQTAKKAE